MTRRERLQFLFTWLALGLLPLFLRPLWEPDEARYAEIPREMLASGNWLTPTLNQVLYFEKPPLQYWLTAASMKLFGVNAVAARLPLALAAALSMGAAYLLARRLGARRPVWASFMAASALLAFACGQALTLDALFSAWMVAALALVVEAVAARHDGRPALGWTLGAFAAMALALLTKGLAAPVILGGILLASLVLAWPEARLRAAVLRTAFSPLGWVTFLALAAPWFVAVDRANPGHARFFFIHEHFARFTSHVHERQGHPNPLLDKLYFLPVLALGLVPWATAALVGLGRGAAFALWRRGPQGEGAALHRWVAGMAVLGAAVPFAFFSLSGSKLPPYVLPAVVPLVALACALEREGEEPKALRRQGLELLVLGLLLALVAPFFLKDPAGLPWALALGAAFAMLGAWALRPRGLTASRWMAALAAALVLLTVSTQKVAGGGKSVEHLVRQAPREAQWLCLGYYFQGIAFRTGQRVTVVAGEGELAYGRDRLSPADRERWFPADPAAFGQVAARLRAEAPDRPVWALSKPGIWKTLTPESQAAWEVVDTTRSALLLRLR